MTWILRACAVTSHQPYLNGRAELSWKKKKTGYEALIDVSHRVIFLTKEGGQNESLCYGMRLVPAKIISFSTIGAGYVELGSELTVLNKCCFSYGQEYSLFQ